MTTYFSKLALDPTVDLGRDLNFEHKRIMALFPESESARSDFGILWRCEGRVFFIQSNVAPDLSLVTGKGLSGVLQVRDDAEEVAVRRIEQGTVGINARINAVLRTDGKERPVPRAELEDWAAALLRRHGFECQPLVTVERSKRLGRSNAIAPSIVVSGRADILYADLALAAWKNGIGRGKSHGFGMLNWV